MKNSISLKIEEAIYDEINKCVSGADRSISDIHDSIVSSVALELKNFISIKNFMNELGKINIYEYININDRDLKNVAINNFIIRAINDNSISVKRSYDLMQNVNFDFNEIKRYEIYDVVDKLMPQIISIIEPPLGVNIRKIVEKTFKNGDIFEDLIKQEKKYVEKEKIKLKCDELCISFRRQVKSLLEAYCDSRVLNNFIDEISGKVKVDKLAFISSFPYEYKVILILRNYIDNRSKNIKISIKDINNYITRKDSYRSVFTIISSEEVLKLVDNTFQLKNKSFNEYYGCSPIVKKKNKSKKVLDKINK